MNRRWFLKVLGLLPFGSDNDGKPWRKYCPHLWTISGTTFDVFVTLPVKTNEYGDLSIYEQEYKIEHNGKVIAQFFLYGRCKNDSTTSWAKLLDKLGKKSDATPPEGRIEFNSWEAIERTIKRYLGEIT